MKWDIPFYIIFFKTFMAHKNRVRPFMSYLGLSEGQPKILDFLVSHDCCMQKDLAEGCNIEPATVSKILNNMEKEGLIERKMVQKNKRAFCVTITKKGRDLQQKAAYYMSELEKLALENFTPKEKEQFIEYLLRMHDNLTGKTLK